MFYPFYVLEQLDSRAEQPITTVYSTQLDYLRRRIERRLQAGVPHHQSEDYRILLDGCEAATHVLEEVPRIIDLWHEEPERDETNGGTTAEDAL